MGGLTSKPVHNNSNKKNNKVVVQHPPKPVSDIDRAILDLKVARDRLQRYRRKLEADDVKLVEQAKAAKAAGKTQTAVGLLRLRKYKQAQAASCEDQLLNVLTMVETIDSKQNEKQLLDALASGKDALKKMHEEKTVDQVLELMEQIQSEISVEQEITDILKEGVPPLSVEDERAVEQELESMQAELEGNNKPISLPTVPSTKLPDPIAQQPVANESATTVKPERVALPG